jgi:hypothetical protein
VPKKNIFSLNLRLNKEKLLKGKDDFWKEVEEGKKSLAPELRKMGIPEKYVKRLRVRDFITKGLGSQIGFHVYDAPPAFHFDLISGMGDILGAASWGVDTGIGLDALLDEEILLVGFLAASASAPAYLSMDVRDAQVVDQFLDALDPVLTRMARAASNQSRSFGVALESYKLRVHPKKKVRGFTFRFGPLKVRFYWARIGRGLYLASKPYILQDLMEAELERRKMGNDGKVLDQGPKGHALVRLRPRNWNQVLADSRLGWAENNREACLNNLRPIANVGRALATQPMPKEQGSAGSWDDRGRRALRHAAKVYGVDFFCPEGGSYLLSRDGRTCKCSVHGTVLEPRQPAAPNKDSQLGRLVDEFADMTATLTFLEDGLRAVVTIERK